MGILWAHTATIGCIGLTLGVYYRQSHLFIKITVLANKIPNLKGNNISIMCCITLALQCYFQFCYGVLQFISREDHHSPVGLHGLVLKAPTALQHGVTLLLHRVAERQHTHLGGIKDTTETGDTRDK